MTAECALLARDLREPLRGTAPEATGWLCIEQPGPWGRDAVTESRLPGAVATSLAEEAAGLDRVRLQLLRRPSGADVTERSAFLVHAGASSRWIRRVGFEDPAELAELDLASLLSPEAPAVGEAHDDPLVLVCTHAKRDACCAVWGRPVAATLEERHPALVWETSHVGGHRFAGNVVMLPHGLAYGFLQPDDALRVVRRHLDGFVDLDTLRGRAGLDRSAQAAEWFVRERSAARGLDDVELTAVSLTDGAASYEAAVGETRYRVELRHEPLGEERITGCDKDAATDPGTWTLVSLEVRG